MYRGIDEIIGEVLRRAGPDTYVVLSSDHGAVPLSTEVRLNNLFAGKGWLYFDFDDRTGQYTIDWPRTRVVFLKMNGIYINPDGLDGNFARASGPKYAQLRREVVAVLEGLRDEDGTPPLARVVPWEEASSLGLPGDRVGDLIIANRKGYGWVETLNRDGRVFVESTVSGYKQAVIPDDETGMWTPFIVVGPGIKPGAQLEKPVRHIDQYPTIMSLLKQDLPSFVEGRPVTEIMSDH